MVPEIDAYIDSLIEVATVIFHEILTVIHTVVIKLGIAVMSWEQ